jgi:hypothetical protein
MAKSTDSYQVMLSHFDEETILGVNIGAKQGRSGKTRPEALEIDAEEVLSEEEQFIKEIPAKSGKVTGIDKATNIVKKKGFWG